MRAGLVAAASLWVAAFGLGAEAASPVAPSSAPASGFEASARPEAETYRYTVTEVRFPSPVRSPFVANDTVWGHLYLPRGAVRPPPCVLVLPVMAAPNVWIEMRFVHALVADRYAVFWLEMPYQFHRRPSALIPSGQVFLARTPRRLAGNFRQSVLDARRAVDWLEGSGLVDPARLGIFGISLGGIVGSAVYSLDARLRAGIFLLAGADFPSLVRRSSMTRDFVRKSGLDAVALRRAWEGLDPAGFREANRGKRALLINVRSDDIIPKENALKLREAFPDARQVWLPLGHYTAMLHLVWVPAYVAWNWRAFLGPP